MMLFKSAWQVQHELLQRQAQQGMLKSQCRNHGWLQACECEFGQSDFGMLFVQQHELVRAKSEKTYNGDVRRGGSPEFSFQAWPTAAAHHGHGVPSAHVAAAAAKLHHHQYHQPYHNHSNHPGQQQQHQPHQYHTVAACTCAAADCDLTDVWGDPMLGSPLVSLPMLSQYELSSIR